MPVEVVLLLALFAALAGLCLVAGIMPPTPYEQQQIDELIIEDLDRQWDEINRRGAPTLDDLEVLWQQQAQAHPVEIDATVIALRVLVEVLYSTGSRCEVARGIFTEITSSTVTLCDPESWTKFVLARSMVLEVRPCAA